MNRARGAKLIIVFAALAAALAVACGGGDDGGSDTATPTSDPIGAAGAAGIAPPGPDAPTVSIGSLSLAADEEGEVELQVLGFPPPGLGAWTVDIEYDPEATSVIECQPLLGTNVCNPEFSASTVRIVGASAQGFEGDSVIGTVRFRCETAGPAALELSVDILADATAGDPHVVTPHVANGTITCSE